MTVSTKRYELSNDEWNRIKKYFTERNEHTMGRPSIDNRTVLNGIGFFAVVLLGEICLKDMVNGIPFINVSVYGSKTVYLKKFFLSLLQMQIFKKFV